MAGELQNNVISKKNSGFPTYLDFTRLRADAISYLGKLSGKLWTDHNMHDPGITILETLIYAMMDLGYRTSLPPADLFARDPNEKGADNNFFSPARILGNNPLTITDLRKLLVDIPGVKNAWLEPDLSTKVDFCQQQPNTGVIASVTYDANPVVSDPCGCDFINGLYHVYLQLEKDPSFTGAPGSFPNKHWQNRIVSRVRKSLMAHRNLCEDFIDIHVLCSFEIGICADIELAQDAPAEDVYLRITTALKEYFSPSPRFYSFEQLLDKGRTVDEIFAGRPYNITESHGFIDTWEFEQLPLRKSLHLSDVYQLLLTVEGVAEVRNLGWIKCCTDKQADHSWVLQLPPDHIPEFSPACSGFKFTRQGLRIATDTEKFATLLNLNVTNFHKGLYKIPSPYLEPAFPKGTYRPDLDQYTSIQHELPRVYGVAEGALPVSAPLKRVAQARQLQGFLLFFDQLLANYLTQLKNIRSLFAYSSDAKKEKNHTYFLNELKDVPHFNELIRFGSGNESSGNEGRALAYPASRKKFDAMLEAGELSHAGPMRRCNGKYVNDFPAYAFCFALDRDQAILQLQEDLKYDEFQPIVISGGNGCYYFYLVTSSPDFVLVSRQFYPSEQEAKVAAASLLFAASFSENIRPFILDKGMHEAFSFSIDLNLNTYSNYLQRIAEDEKSYTERRQQFLDHLLARFAEQFTDYALLSAGIAGNQLGSWEIRAKEKMLKHYDDLSSNRGKAYDYRVDGWNNHNISGFEKRFKALSGIENWKRHYLCNFVVEPADAEYYLSIKLFDEQFAVPLLSFNKKAAHDSLVSIFQKLRHEPQFEPDWDQGLQRFRVYIKDSQDLKYLSSSSFKTQEEALLWSERLEKILDFTPNMGKDIKPATYIHRVLVSNNAGTVIAEGVEKKKIEEVAEYAAKLESHLSTNLADPKIFSQPVNLPLPQKLVFRSRDENYSYFLDEDEFKCKLSDEYKMEKEGKRFTLLNLKHRLQFNALSFHEKPGLARDECKRLLLTLHDVFNYKVEEDQDEKVWKIFVMDGETKVAVYLDTFRFEREGWDKVEEVIRVMDSNTYRLHISEPIVDTWEFTYSPTDLAGKGYVYTSKNNYHSDKTAEAAATEFYKSIPVLELKTATNEIVLSVPKSRKLAVSATFPELTEEIINEAGKLLDFQKEAHATVQGITEEKLNQLLEVNRKNPGENYIYKLVDKDNPIAIHPISFSAKADAINARDDLFNNIKQHDFLDIALGGDIVHERKEIVKKQTFYHYQVKATNRYYRSGRWSGQPMILFESVKGYASREEAIKAFDQNFILIMRKAIHEKNYGKDQFIGYTVSYTDAADSCITRANTVFIPKETSDEFKGYELQKELALMVRTYPLRFYGPKNIRFAAGRLIPGINKNFEEDWRATKRYRTIHEALHAFHFFLALLKYKGNFLVQWDEMTCRFHIYIREVLAVSAYGFDTATAAWGVEGVEKFIGVTQAKGGFHNYWSANSCGYSFFAACGYMGLRHPCTYETPRRRDEMMGKLFRAARSFRFEDLIVDIGPNHITLDDKLIDPCVDPASPPLVLISLKDDKKKYGNLCDWLVRFVDAVYIDENYVKEAGKYYLVIKDKTGNTKKIAEPLDPKLGLKQWKKRLQNLAAFIPFYLKDGKYFVRIKLPGLGNSGEGIVVNDPCGCNEIIDDCDISCYTAWISECCFDSCCKALEFYVYIYELLNASENYKPVYDCNCGSYRIELHPTLSPSAKMKLSLASLKSLEFIHKLCDEEKSTSVNYENTKQVKIKEKDCFAGIVAINPQTYVSEKAACEAVERAKSLINSEGLHLVEHILLRPRCKNKDGVYEDCNCEGLPRPCIPGDADTICHFKWIPSGDPDPCEMEDGSTCFTPGCDPYSFIATVALPAWPQRFHSPEARSIVEKLLQREAPAHVMLRILWLNPRDFCCFEHHYKIWNEWLANKLCKDYSSCDFLTFLFGNTFPAMKDTPACVPCDNEVAGSDCFKPEEIIPCPPFSIQLNKLYCWGMDNKMPVYTPCEPALEDVLTATNTGGAVMKSKTPVALRRARDSRYKKIIKDLPEKYSESKIVHDTGVFFSNTEAIPERFHHIIEEIAGEKLYSKEAPGFNELQWMLIIACTWKYMDLACFGKEAIKNLTEVKDVFQSLVRNGIDMQEVYNEWHPEEVLIIAPATDPDQVKNILFGGADL